MLMQKPGESELELHFSGSRAAIVDFQWAYIGPWKNGWQASLRDSSEGQRCPGRLDILQENLKGAGQGCPHELAGKKTGLAGIQEKKQESSCSLEERVGHLELQGRL